MSILCFIANIKMAWSGNKAALNNIIDKNLKKCRYRENIWNNSKIKLSKRVIFAVQMSII